MKKQKETITFEGFYDVNSGYEFDMPLFLISPFIRLFDVGNSGEIENIIEDYFIDKDCNTAWKNDKGLKISLVQSDFEKSKKKSKRFKYWSAVVEFSYNEKEKMTDYKIVKRKGF